MREESPELQLASYGSRNRTPRKLFIMELQKATGYLKAAYYQGHGRYVNQILRLTLKFCKNNPGSREVRKFIETRLVDVAKENPGVVIYVKPRMYKNPVLTTEYISGEQHYLNLTRVGCESIEEWMKWHIHRSGDELYKLHRPVATYRPSIQGIWTPFYFRNPRFNKLEFPNEECSRFIPRKPTATQQVERLAKEYSQEQVQQS